MNSIEKKDQKEQEKSDWINQIQKIREYSSEQFDKLIVYLSSGALILTLGFVKDIVPMTKETNKSLLIISWSLFTLALILMLLSHKASIISMDYELNEKSHKSNFFDKITELLNWASTFSLMTGVITFIIFVYKHI
jgi:hypothetical protein